MNPNCIDYNTVELFKNDIKACRNFFENKGAKRFESSDFDMYREFALDEYKKIHQTKIIDPFKQSVGKIDHVEKRNPYQERENNYNSLETNERKFNK